MPREFSGPGLASFDIIAEIASVTLDRSSIFVERLEQFQDFSKLFLAELLAVGQVFQSHILGAELNQDLVELDIVLHVLHALLA